MRELRQNASRYLAQVEAGEVLGVTSQGRLVARLVPIDDSERTRGALVNAGVLIPARRNGPLVVKPPLPSRDGLTDLLHEMREDR